MRLDADDDAATLVEENPELSTRLSEDKVGVERPENQGTDSQAAAEVTREIEE